MHGRGPRARGLARRGTRTVLLAALLALPFTLGTAAPASAGLTLCGLFKVCATSTPPPPPVCSDGKDNDGDGKIDAADPGCRLPRDTNEADDDQQYGFNDSGWADYRIPRSSWLSYFQQTGGGVHRMQIDWQFAQPKGPTTWEDTYWSTRDQLYSQELDIGVRPLMLVLGTPQWALTKDGNLSNGGAAGLLCDGYNNCNAPPDVRNPSIRDAWMEWIRRVVRHYPLAAGIEVWNEPNLRYFWYIDQDPALYGLMLKYAKQAAAEVDPSMPVLMGGLSGWAGPSDAKNLSMEDFVRRAYPAAGASSFDAISYHASPCPTASPTDNMASITNRLRQLKAEQGDSAKPLWLTETGVTNGASGTAANCNEGFTEADGATAMTKDIAWAKQQQADHGDLPVVLVNTLFNTAPRMFMSVSANGQAETGLIAYTYNSWSKRTTTYAKPAFAAVSCKFRGTC